MPDFTAIPPDNELRDSERVPSVEETLAIQTSLFPARDTVYKLNESLRQIRRLRDAAAAALLDRESAIAPIRAMPPEILEVIFSFSCKRIYHIGHKEPLPFHWTIIRVCRRWRRLLLNLPMMWSRLRVRFSQQRHSSNLLRHLQFVLMCSRETPLQVLCYGCLKTDLEEERKAAVAAVEMCRVFFSSCHRWKTADIRLSNYPLDVLLPLHHNLPLLEEFHLYVNPPQRVPNQPVLDVRRVFDDAPLLKIVTVYHPKTLTFEFPWSQVTEFNSGREHEHIDGEYSSHCCYMIDAISKAQNLERFGFDCESSRIIDDSPFQHQPATNGTLRALTLNESRLMDLLTLPAATSVTLRFLDYDPSAHLASRLLLSFNLFIHRSHCTITSLKIDHCPPIERLHNVVAELQGLTSLQLSFYKRRAEEIDHVLHSAFNFLTGPDKETPAFPALTHVRIRVSPKFHFGSYLEAQVFTLTTSLEALLGMVNKYRIDKPKLSQIAVEIETDQKVTLVDAVPDPSSNATFTRLKKCSKEGLPKISLKIRHLYGVCFDHCLSRVLMFAF